MLFLRRAEVSGMTEDQRAKTKLALRRYGTRQLFAQYPDEETLKRCVVMQYFDNDANTRAYKMYNNVTAS